MATTKKQMESAYKYKAKKIKRVPLDMQSEYYENTLQPAATAAGLPINSYIKQAIAEKIEREATNHEQ